MQPQKEHSAELQEFPALQQIKQENTFIVPEDYFDNLSERIRQRIFLEELQETIKETGFTIPKDYFSELPDRIQSSLFVDTLKEEIIYSGFEVPEDYFNKNTETIQSNLDLAKPNTGKIIPLPQWVKYAAAACIFVAGGLFIGINQFKKQPSLEEQFAQVPDQEIVNYLTTYSDPGDTEVIIEKLGNTKIDFSNQNEELSVEELEEYLKNSSL